MDKQRVWLDFGNGVVCHEEDSVAEMNAFLAGVDFATQQCGCDDFCQMDSEEEVRVHEEECTDA